MTTERVLGVAFVLSVVGVIFLLTWLSSREPRHRPEPVTKQPYENFSDFKRDLLNPKVSIEAILERCDGAVPAKPAKLWYTAPDKDVTNILPKPCPFIPAYGTAMFLSVPIFYTSRTNNTVDVYHHSSAFWGTPLLSSTWYSEGPISY